MTEFIRGARTAERMTPDASGPEHRVERGGEAGVPVMQHEPHPRPGLDHGKDVDLGAVEQVGGEEVQRQDALCLGP